MAAPGWPMMEITPPAMPGRFGPTFTAPNASVPRSSRIRRVGPTLARASAGWQNGMAEVPGPVPTQGMPERT